MTTHYRHGINCQSPDPRLTSCAREMGCVPHLGLARETVATCRALRCAVGMGSLSMATKREITRKYAREYAPACRKTRGRMLDELVATTGWSRANARRQFRAAGEHRGPRRAVKRAHRPRTCGYDTLKSLISVWMLAGQPSGKYLAATMSIWLPTLIEHGELDVTRLNDHTRAHLLAVSIPPSSPPQARPWESCARSSRTPRCLSAPPSSP